MRLIDGWKPTTLKIVWAGVNTMSVMLAGMNGREVPWGGAKVKYAIPRTVYKKDTALDGKRNDVIFGD